MTNATDIITYIGVPLAVLGVLPILYTFLHSRLTTRAIRHSLARHGLLSHATTRSSLMSSVVEVSLPRVLITPLSRTSARYWAVNRSGAAGVRGGTWTTMHWNRLVMGSKLYRVQYSEDLRVPQAEVELGQLLGFLLDRGAVPDAKGIRMLRVSGLWTPTGTSVMLSPDARHSALRVSVPDDSDGVLSLALRWEAEWDEREPESLPPEWMRLEVPRVGIGEGDGDRQDGRREAEEEKEEEQEEQEEQAGDLLDVDDQSKDDGMVDVEKTIAAKSFHLPEPTSLRFRLGSLPSTSHSTATALAICMATWESSHAPLPYSPSLTHLHSGPASAWFPSIALSLGLSKSLPLYTYTLPPSLYSLATKDTVPCGVLVMLGLLAAESAPDWETKYDPLEDGRAHHNNFLAKQRSMAAERMMGAEQARVARVAREAAELHQMGEDFRARITRQREREARREREAFASGRLEARVVADAATEWLTQEKILRKGAGTQEAVEGLLIRMVKQEEAAIGVFGLLERWKEWSDRGGMNTEDLAIFRTNKVGFCYALCVMALFKEVCAKEESSLAADMQECIRCWKTVRLG